MPERIRSHPLIVLGGAFFAWVAGVINMVGLLSATHSAVSHMTGTISHLVESGFTGNPGLAVRTGTMLLSFVSGAAISGAVTSGGSLSFRRRYGVLVFLEGLLLLLASYCFRSSNAIAGEALCALVCGMQNGMVTIVSGAIVRTTHLTGIVTDIGTHLGQVLRGGTLHWNRMRLHLGILVGFCAGGFMAGLLFYQWEYVLLDGLAGMLILIGATYMLVRHLRPDWLPGRG
ncbi:MAG: DUF1275 domain-containing protein [Leptospiraceae bacterium]|nr:DUF1275 domain-containing protein [Leptospiraceae bacterium]